MFKRIDEASKVIEDALTRVEEAGHIQDPALKIQMVDQSAL